MKVWITKYALTLGIIEIEGEPLGTSFATKDQRFPLDKNDFFIRQGYWFENKKDAINDADEMRQKEIESLKKQIKKLEEMKFE